MPAEGGSDTTVEDISQAVAERTPVPTPTPGLIADQVDDLAQATGLAGKSFLGLAAEDWINLAISALVLVVGYFVGASLLVRLLKNVARRTSTPFDDAFLDSIGDEIKWLVMLLFSRLAILRLDFLGDGLRAAFVDVFFVLGLLISTIIAFKLINFGAQWYKDNWEHQEDRDRLDPIITILQRLGYVLVVIVGASIALSHFGINVTAVSAALLFVAIVISLGAKDIISDAMSGFLILLDQPFRVDDTIQIEELNKRGTVVDIGTRTTRILTRDNRLVIIPNSKIGTSQVVNDTYPDPRVRAEDPRVRAETHVGVAYGSDYHQVRRVIQDAVRGVEGVLPDQPVDVLFVKFGRSDRIMRVRWWMDTIDHIYPMLDRVNAAVERALEEAGIEMPFDTYDLNVKMEGVE
jgi:small-conductance mechanosensitive channel